MTTGFCPCNSFLGSMSITFLMLASLRNSGYNHRLRIPVISTLLLATPPAKADAAETLALAIGAVLVELHLSQMKLAPGLTENLTWIKNKSFPNHFSSKVLVKTAFLLTSIKSDTPRFTTPSWISWSVVHQVRLPTYSCHLNKI